MPTPHPLTPVPTVSVSRVIKATPERLYDMISDLPRMGEWSPENRGGRWMGGATCAVPQARFKGKNANGWRKWSTKATVLVADRPREFVFEVTSRAFRVAKWGYLLEPVTGGTKVTETWYDNRSPLFAKVAGAATGRRNRMEYTRTSMEHTLEKLAAAAE